MGYCTVADIRAEGFTAVKYPEYTDDWVQAKIDLATIYIDRVTHRWFEARTRTMRVDGLGSSTLRLRVPGIIQVDSVRLITGLGDDFDAEDVELDEVVVYNRHLTMGLEEPDDRSNPRLETFETESRDTTRATSNWFGTFYQFPRGRQNVEVGGVFGFTELAEGVTPSETVEGNQIPTSQGITPPLISEACKLIVVRDLVPMEESEDREDARSRYRMLQEKTRHQSYKRESLSKLAMTGFATGDVEIDGILAIYTGGSGTTVSAV